MQWTRAVSWTVAIVLSLLFLGELVFMAIASFPGTMVPDVENDRFGLSFSGEELLHLAQASVMDCVTILLGVIGCGLMVAAIARRRLSIPPPLTLAALSSVCLGGFLLIGYDLAYADFDGSIPRLEHRWMETVHGGPSRFSFSVPALLVLWDVFEHAGLNLMACILLFGLAAGTLRLPAVAAVALFTTIIGFPVVLSWTEGNAQLLGLAPADCWGAFPIHVLAGAAGLGVIVAARFLPCLPPGRIIDPQATPTSRPDQWHRLSRRQLLFFLLGLVFLLLAMIRPSRIMTILIFGLSPERPFLDRTTLAVVIGGASALLASLLLRRRSIVQCLAVGCLAGWAIVAADSDDMTARTCVTLGIVAGVLTTLLLYLLDHHRFDDPLGIIPAQLVCGSLGALVAGMPPLEGMPPIERDYGWDWSSILEQAGAVLATGLLGFTIGGVVALVAWLTGTLWEPTAPCRSRRPRLRR